MRAVLYAWVGLIFPKKCAGPGTKGLIQQYFYLLASFGDALYIKIPRAPRKAPGGFDLRTAYSTVQYYCTVPPEAKRKNIFWAPAPSIIGLWWYVVQVPPSIKQPSQKHQTLTFIGYHIITIQEPIFLFLL